MKSTAILACVALTLGLVTPAEVHLHPGAQGSAVIHCHFGNAHPGHLQSGSSSGAAIDDNDDHSRAVYVTAFCVITQSYPGLVALSSQLLEPAPLRVVAAVAFIEQRSHDPPTLFHAQPRSPPA